MNFFFFDTETTGLPNRSQNVPYNDPTQPHITQLGGILQVGNHDAMIFDTLIKPDNWRTLPCGGQIGARAKELTGITEEMCEASGIPIRDAMNLFVCAADNADFLVCHNKNFDQQLVMFEYARICPDDRPSNAFMGTPALCTMLTLTPILKIPKKDGRVGNKWPKLEEAYPYIFGEMFPNAHNAMIDIEATRRVFNWCVREGLFDAEFAKFGYERPVVPEDFCPDILKPIKDAA
jgi:DNA polymerase-3 subunit epsilon